MRGLEGYCGNLAACTTPEAVGDLFQRTIANEGYSSSACRIIRPAGNGGLHLSFRNWPENWAKLSEERDYNNRSPVLAAARRHVVPFTWGDISTGTRLTRADTEFWDVVREWGWSDGFAVPIHGPGGSFSYIGMGTRERDLDLGAKRRSYLHMVAVLAHERCHALYDIAAPDHRHEALNGRALECMRWVADGKSDWEIGTILGISSATVRFHVDNARRKLGAVTRAQAVAKMFAGDAAASNDRHAALNGRVLECMRWVADGKSDWEIGMILGISSATVRFHVDNARRKLGAVTRAQAVAKMFTGGLL